MRHSFERKRRGVSLIETAVIMAVSAVIFALTIAVFARFLDMNRSGQQHFERVMTIERLAEQFRRDVWAAVKVKDRQPEATSLVLSMIGNANPLIPSPSPHTLDRVPEPGAKGASVFIAYSIEAGVVIRTVQHGDKLVGREVYRLPGARVVRFETMGTGPGSSVALRWGIEKITGADGEMEPGPLMAIRATVGRDHRFATAGEASSP